MNWSSVLVLQEQTNKRQNERRPQKGPGNGQREGGSGVQWRCRRRCQVAALRRHSSSHRKSCQNEHHHDSLWTANSHHYWLLKRKKKQLRTMNGKLKNSCLTAVTERSIEKLAMSFVRCLALFIGVFERRVGPQQNFDSQWGYVDL